MNRTAGNDLTSRIVPEDDMLFGLHGVKAGEPLGVARHVARATRINQPHVLQASILSISKKTKDEKMAQHWG